MKAKLTRIDGSVLEVEGSPEEIKEALFWERPLFIRPDPPPLQPIIAPYPVPVSPYVPQNPWWVSPNTTPWAPPAPPYITCGDPPNTCGIGGTGTTAPPGAAH
jgi:hypothetical protein